MSDAPPQPPSAPIDLHDTNVCVETISVAVLESFVVVELTPDHDHRALILNVLASPQRRRRPRLQRSLLSVCLASRLLSMSFLPSAIDATETSCLFGRSTRRKAGDRRRPRDSRWSLGDLDLRPPISLLPRLSRAIRFDSCSTRISPRRTPRGMERVAN